MSGSNNKPLNSSDEAPKPQGGDLEVAATSKDDTFGEIDKRLSTLLARAMELENTLLHLGDPLTINNDALDVDLSDDIEDAVSFEDDDFGSLETDDLDLDVPETDDDVDADEAADDGHPLDLSLHDD